MYGVPSVLCVDTDWVVQRNPNEIIVELDSDLDAHVSRACGLLEVSVALYLAGII